MKFKTKSMIATFIILFISGSAFLAGFLQEYYLAQVTTLRKKATDLQGKIERMEAKINFLLGNDVKHVYRSNELRNEAGLLDVEFQILNNTLLDEERNNYIYQISQLLTILNNLRGVILFVQIARHFNSSTVNFNIANEEDVGYDLIIT